MSISLGSSTLNGRKPKKEKQRDKELKIEIKQNNNQYL